MKPIRRLVTVILALAMTLTSSLTFLPQPAHAQEGDYEYTKDTSKFRIPAARAKVIIDTRAREVLLAIKNLDLLKLSGFVHPRKGVRFSTYAWIDKNDKWLSRQQVRNLARSDQRALWFYVDEAGTPMHMTARKYLRDYVYEYDYLNATRVNYNTQHKRGIVIPNVLDFYPRAIVVEYYEPSPNPNERGWDTLWLVFEKMGNQWYLVGVVKDSPSI
ncbi:MAG: hypothetical protein LC731_07720 [Acidobacteria bacterium]|nr:hypothetical protein [Acidobacteriota bacterium]